MQPMSDLLVLIVYGDILKDIYFGIRVEESLINYVNVRQLKSAKCCWHTIETSCVRVYEAEDHMSVQRANKSVAQASRVCVWAISFLCIGA